MNKQIDHTPTDINWLLSQAKDDETKKVLKKIIKAEMDFRTEMLSV